MAALCSATECHRLAMAKKMRDAETVKNEEFLAEVSASACDRFGEKTGRREGSSYTLDDGPREIHCRLGTPQVAKPGVPV